MGAVRFGRLSEFHRWLSAKEKNLYLSREDVFVDCYRQGSVKCLVIHATLPIGVSTILRWQWLILHACNPPEVRLAVRSMWV